MTYNAASYNDLVRDAANAVIRGVDDGLACMEVEFPPIMGLDCAHSAWLTLGIAEACALCDPWQCCCSSVCTRRQQRVAAHTVSPAR